MHKQQEMNTDIIKPSEYKDQRKREREVKWHEKVMHAQFFRDTDGIVDRKKSWLWLKNGDLKKGTEALLWQHKDKQYVRITLNIISTNQEIRRVAECVVRRGNSEPHHM